MYSEVKLRKFGMFESLRVTKSRSRCRPFFPDLISPFDLHLLVHSAFFLFVSLFLNRLAMSALRMAARRLPRASKLAPALESPVRRFTTCNVAKV